MKRRAAFLGLDKPITYNISTWQNEILELLKSGKITIEQVRKELGNELTARLFIGTGSGESTSGEVETTGEVLEGEFISPELLNRRE